MISATFGGQGSIRVQLTRRLSLRHDEDIRSLAAAIEDVLDSPQVRRDDAANYAAWLGETPGGMPRPRHNLVEKVAIWFGLLADNDVVEISDEAWEARKTDCVAYAVRIDAEQPINLFAIVSAAMPAVDDMQVENVCQDIWQTFATIRDANPQASRSDHVAMLHWVVGVRLHELSIPVPGAFPVGPLVRVEQERFWAGEPMWTQVRGLPVWSPAGDGTESLRIHTAVAQVINEWVTAHPIVVTRSFPNEEPITREVQEMTSRLNTAEKLLRDTYRQTFAPSQSSAPGTNLQVFARWWIILTSVCLSITAATANGVWRTINHYVGTPTLASTIIWGVRHMSITIGFFGGFSALSLGIGMLWEKHVSRLRLWILKAGIGFSLWLTLILITPCATRSFLMVNLSDYLGFPAWWEGAAPVTIASLVANSVSLVSFLAATGVAEDCRHIVRKPQSLTEALGRARYVTVEVGARLEELVLSNTPWDTLEPTQIRINHLVDLAVKITNTTIPRVQSTGIRRTRA